MQLWHSIMAFVSNNNANSGQISQDTLLSQLCVLSACNLSRKVGSPEPGPGQASGQLQQSTVTSGPVWSLNRRPQSHWGGNWCQHSWLECRYCQFPLIAVEVPPSALWQGKHLVLIVLSLRVNMRVGKRRTSGGKWLAQVVISWILLRGENYAVILCKHNCAWTASARLVLQNKWPVDHSERGQKFECDACQKNRHLGQCFKLLLIDSPHRARLPWIWSDFLAT